MKPVWQRGKHDCGVAILATLTGHTYDEVEKVLLVGGWDRRRGTRTWELYEASVVLGKPLVSQRLNRRAEWREVPVRSLVKREVPGRKSWHWVTKIGGRCWDPARGWISIGPLKRVSFVRMCR